MADTTTFAETAWCARMIREMPAGAEMDAHVACRVMGWRFCAPDEPFRLHRERGGCVTEHGPMIFNHPTGVIPDEWHPSNNVADAWHVMQKCGLGIARANGGWTVFRIKPGADFAADRLSVWPLGWWESAPEGICKAALIDRLKLESLCTATP